MNKLFDIVVRVTYAVIFPIVLLFFALTGYFQIQRQFEVETYKNSMNNRLNLLFDYHKDTVFFHALLQSNFRIADKSKEPQIAITQMIERFKFRFGKGLKFIVWNKFGKLNSKLSDIKNYKYVLKIMYKVINYWGASSRVKIANKFASKFLKNKINLLRKILGRFLLPEQMHLPFNELYLGECLVTDTSNDKGLVWYQSGQNFSIVCLIPKQKLNKNISSQILTNRFNCTSKDIKLGACDLMKGSLYGLKGLSSSLLTELKLEIEKYKQAASQFRETKNFLLLFRQPSDKLLVFSYIQKHNKLINIRVLTIRIICKILAIFILFSFILYNYRLRKKRNSLQVKHSLIILFLFVNIVGVFTIIAVSSKFFEYKRIVLINEIQKDSLKILKKINLKYKGERKQISSQLTQFIDKRNKLFGSEKWSERALQKLKVLVAKLSSPEAVIIDKEHKVYALIDNDAVLEKSPVSQSFFFKTILDFANNIDKKTIQAKYKAAFANIKYSRILRHAINKLKVISLTKLGIRESWSYINLLGDSEHHNNWGVISLIWSLNKLQDVFFTNNIDQINRDISPRKLLIMNKEQEKIYPTGIRINDTIESYLHLAFYRSKIVVNKLKYIDKDYIAIAAPGSNILNCSMMLLYPRALMETKILELKLMTFLIIFFSSFILLIIVWTFSSGFIEPIISLEKGISSIQKNDFKQLITNISSDELGDLEILLNEVMANMEMLSMGTSIQKDLLPARTFKKGNVELYADSEFMTKMGGDYFDYFEKDSEFLTILFGDVAGHGIPAGMIMGIVKALFMDASFETLLPLDILKKINSILMDLRKKGWKGMMTCQCIDINCFSGNLSLANAGHCYPLIVSSEGDGRFLKNIGSPLGLRMSRRSKEVPDILFPGEVMVLYSDGIIEATNKNGEQFGYERFEKLIIESWSDDIKVFWQSVYSKYNEWTHVQDDDITFMLVKMMNR